MAPVPGRKTLVLISGGIVSSDMPGGRPDNHVLGSMAGRTAAESNVSVYTLYIDQVWCVGWPGRDASRPQRPDEP